jgi:hypothetical protein
MVQAEEPLRTGVRLSPVQRIKLLIMGAVATSRRSRPGWSGSLQFYAFRCPVHGLVENYPQGYERVLRCPYCDIDATKNGAQI